MNNRYLFLLLSFLVTGMPAYFQGKGTMEIEKIELDYPSPSIPFYHFKADLKLPQPSIIEGHTTLDEYLDKSNTFLKIN